VEIRPARVIRSRIGTIFAAGIRFPGTAALYVRLA